MSALDDPTGGHAGPFAWLLGAVVGSLLTIFTAVGRIRVWIREEASLVFDQRIAAHNEDEHAHPDAINLVAAPILAHLEAQMKAIHAIDKKLTGLLSSHTTLTASGAWRCRVQTSPDSDDEQPALSPPIPRYIPKLPPDIPLSRRAGDPEQFDPRPARSGGGVRAGEDR